MSYVSAVYFVCKHKRCAGPIDAEPSDAKSVGVKVYGDVFGHSAFVVMVF